MSGDIKTLLGCFAPKTLTTFFLKKKLAKKILFVENIMDRKKKYDEKFIRKTIRFTPDEYEKIEEQREKTNLDFTSFCKSAILKKKVKQDRFINGRDITRAEKAEIRGEIYRKLKMSYSRSFLLISCYPMCTKYTIQGMFIPQDDIQRRIDEVVAGFSERTIGVHIRRTDNVVSIQSSPLENFTNMMDAEIKKKANTKFYVASDDDEVKESLKSKYPNRIITLMDDTDRNSLEGMKFAVLD